MTLPFHLPCSLLVAALFASILAEPAPAHRAVVAYLFPQDRLLNPREIAVEQLTRINYAFANIKKGRVVAGFSHDHENLQTILQLKARNPRLQVLVSVGGWSWSGGFSDAALTPESRIVFIESAIDFIRIHKLDGIDIDWEYPGQSGNGNRHRPEDKGNFTALLRALRHRLDRESRAWHRPLLLSIAAGASEEYLANTEMKVVQSVVDSINLMTYDYYTPSVDHRTGHHAPLYADPDEPKGVSASRSVDSFIQAGVPAGKLLLGVPFYGHAWTHVDEVRHGLFQHGQKSDLEPDYRTVRELVSTKKYVRYWDARSDAPYLYDSASRTFITYEDAESLRLKCRYALRKGLGGVMFWEYSNDPSGELLRTIYRALF